MPGCGTMPGYIIGAGCIMNFFFLSLLSLLEELLPLFFLGTKTPFLSL